MSDFRPFAAAVKAQFDAMSQHELFTTAMPPDDVYAAYLAAFPPGTNPIFRERTEHDCSCCRNFIKNIGNVVAIIDGVMVSVWDVKGLEYPYDAVAAEMAQAITAFPIDGLFRPTEPTYGAESSRELRGDQVHTWNHFHAAIAAKHRTSKAATEIGDYATTVSVFKRGLDELTPAAFATVIELIEAKTLYKGDEFLPVLMGFRGMKSAYDMLKTDGARNTFVWQNAGHRTARFRNTAIGTLVIDLSAGRDLEDAVKAYEKVVAPTNYKRPSALVTPKMIALAMTTIKDLGLEEALQRRFAKISDVSVNNVLWVDGTVQGQMKGGIEGLLLSTVRPSILAAVAESQAQSISIADFMATVLPQAKSIDLVVKNAHQSNFISLTAPVHADPKRLFKWGNDFAWSYAGEVTDAIKERVKAAGGTVEGDLCCRLAWEYLDDLDFHMYEPGGHHISFSNRRHLSPNGGMLDLDANGCDGQREDPAENIFYTNRRKMKEGIYTLKVNNYSRRSNGKGFVVQIEFDGQVHNIVYDKVLRDSETIIAATIQYKAGVFTIVESLPASQSQRSVWGVTTEAPSKVATIMHSPNYWDDNAVGNKHFIFILDGCRNPAPARGIYNEFLRSDLEQHRKVFETLGDKTKCQPTEDQLSGVGFSSTRGDSVIVSVTGEKLRKTYNINF